MVPREFEHVSEWVWRGTSYAIRLLGIKPWPNGTPNSSQLEPSYKSKRASAGGQTVPPRRASSQENHSIVWLRPHSHLTITKQLGKSWLELAEMAKRWKTWLELGENLSLIKFTPAWSNSSQVGAQTIPNSIGVVNLARVGLSWEDRLARALGPAFCPFEAINVHGARKLALLGQISGCAWRHQKTHLRSYASCKSDTVICSRLLCVEIWCQILSGHETPTRSCGRLNARGRLKLMLVAEL